MIGRFFLLNGSSNIRFPAKRWQTLLATLALTLLKANAAVTFFNFSPNSEETIPPGAALELDTTVLPAGLPHIIRQPYWRPVAIGSNEAFFVETLSRGPVKYQWLRDNVEIHGATNAICTVENAQLSHAATYSVSVENFAGRIVSHGAELVITNLPSVGGLLLCANQSPSVDAQLLHNWPPHSPMGPQYVVDLFAGPRN